MNGIFALKFAQEVASGGGIGRGLAPTGSAGETEAAEFDRLVEEYEALRTTPENEADVVGQRHRIADRLGRLTLRLKKDRLSLAAGGIGMRVALATATFLEPADDDLHALETASARQMNAFTGYRLLLAIIAVSNRSLHLRRDRTRLIKVAEEVTKKANKTPSLQRLADSVLKALR